MPAHPTAIHALLRGGLRTLTQSAQQHARLAERLRALLPDAAAPHLVGVVDGDDELTVYVDSPAWATRLRFLLPDLQRRLQRDGRRARVRVLPAEGSRRPLPPRVNRPSTDAVDAVRGAARDTPPGPVAIALERLAAALARRQTP
jgi:hypothetical protein